MVTIPAGHFMMGAPMSEAGASSIESPLHSVAIASFVLGRFDVTRGEWAAFVRATRRKVKRGCAYTGRPGPFLDPLGSWESTGFAQSDRHPAVCLNWQDAVDYTAWLSRRTGWHYRLPSEAEWEYAARAGARTAYSWGKVADRGHANYGPDHGYGKGVAAGRDRWIHTSPVGAFPPNRFGLYDMSGNVLQFVADCLSTYDQTPRDGSAQRVDRPLKLGGDFKDLDGSPSCGFRMVRGGDWADPPEMLRAGFRNFAPAPPETLTSYRSTGLGFRVARDLR
jgi:formylglycine-generating enzyme required for sulfatase activity